MIELRDYQVSNAQLAHHLLSSLGIAYLAMEVRTGKTLTALEAARLYGAKHVLFLTKKNAMSSIKGDYEKLNPGYHLTVINDQSLHKVEEQPWDLLIYDEAHRCFVGNTLIDGKMIKDIKVGSFQSSFNHDRQVFERKRVLNVFKNPLTENLIKIKCNGKEIVCTESHEIYTKRGWIKAKDLLPTDELQVV